MTSNIHPVIQKMCEVWRDCYPNEPTPDLDRGVFDLLFDNHSGTGFIGVKRYKAGFKLEIVGEVHPSFEEAVRFCLNVATEFP